MIRMYIAATIAMITIVIENKEIAMVSNSVILHFRRAPLESTANIIARLPNISGRYTVITVNKEPIANTKATEENALRGAS